MEPAILTESTAWCTSSSMLATFAVTCVVDAGRAPFAPLGSGGFCRQGTGEGPFTAMFLPPSRKPSSAGVGVGDRSFGLRTHNPDTLQRDAPRVLRKRHHTHRRKTRPVGLGLSENTVDGGDGHTLPRHTRSFFLHSVRISQECG